MKKIALKELPDELNNTFKNVFICCASFESRSKCVATALKDFRFEQIFIFANQDSEESICSNAKEICALFNKIDHDDIIVKTKHHNPLETTDNIVRVIEKIANNQVDDVIIDITTFTHEMLLILIRLLYNNKNSFKRIICVYTGAKEYSVGEPDERKWLSKGCKDIRSVMGYPGVLIPGRPTCLYVLVGFEHERATRMIAEIDPEYLLLGKGKIEQITHRSHEAPMEFFHRLVQNMTSSRGRTTKFEFSPDNPYETANTILHSLSEDNIGCNHIIVPLNTKISTIGIALAAIKKPSIQICYAESEIYNTLRYSEPDIYVRVFELNFL